MGFWAFVVIGVILFALFSRAIVELLVFFIGLAIVGAAIYFAWPYLVAMPGWQLLAIAAPIVILGSILDA